MIILDTDLLSHIQVGQGPLFVNLTNRLNATQDTVAVTILSLEEQLRGWLAQIAKAKTSASLTRAYLRLHDVHDFFARRTLLDFDAPAAQMYERLVRMRLGVGTMDLRIAAVTLSRDALLLTRNLRDFRKIPSLRTEDWAASM